MPANDRAVRQSVSLPVRLAKRVKSLAIADKRSANRVIVELIESGLEARDREKQTFLDLADQLARSKDAGEQARLKAELARMTYGD